MGDSLSYLNDLLVESYLANVVVTNRLMLEMSFVS